jgi:uncharacterized protein (UPF0548 family)
MKTLFIPGDETIKEWIQGLQTAPLTYPAHESGVPAGYRRDEIRCRLGFGGNVWTRACQGIRDWQMFPREMTTLRPASVPIAVDQVVSVSFRVGPLLTINPARIVEVVDSSAPQATHNNAATAADGVDRFGFAYGTLPGHIESGRELFLVEWNHADDSVWYSIDVFSRPAFWLIWLGYPYARWQQTRFRRLSAAAMREFCREAIQ